MERVSTPATGELTAELDGATDWLGVATDEMLLASLARTIARVIGDGVAAVDVADEHRCRLYSVPLACVSSQLATPTELLGDVHRVLAVAPQHGAHPSAEIFLNYVGDASADSALIHEPPTGLGHALEVRAYRIAGLVHLDWWYDPGRFEPYTVEELTEQFPFALFEMTSDAAPPA